MTIQQLQDKLQRHMSYLEQDKTNINLFLSVELLKANILHHEEKIDEAIMRLESLAIEHRSNADIAGLLALLHFDNHDETQAELFSNRALALHPTQYEAQLVRILLRALRNEVTLEEIESLLAISPNDSRLWFVLGTTLMREMNLVDAEQAFLRAAEIWPAFYDNWICMAWCQLLQNKLEPAEQAYQHAREIDMDIADGFGGLALINALRNHLSEAQTWLQKSTSLDPNCFLASITRIIIANQSSQEQAATVFNATFPKVETEINRVLVQAVQTLSANDKIVH